MTQLRDPVNRVSHRARLYWTVRAVPAWLVVGGVESGILWGGTAGLTWLVGGITLVLAIAHLVVMPQWRYRVHSWEITETAVYTQSGWFSQERRIAPIARVQTVDTQRGPLEQVFGLSNLTVTTASSRVPMKIHALDLAVADATVAWLTQRAQLEGGDGT